MITSILDNEIDKSDYIEDSIFGLNIPQSIKDIPNDVLNPEKSWSNKDLYNKEAKKLSDLFKGNFKKYGDLVTHLIKYGPK